jgi:heme/copper-type cytochrome/quinol oxidase subunit 2
MITIIIKSTLPEVNPVPVSNYRTAANSPSAIRLTRPVSILFIDFGIHQFTFAIIIRAIVKTIDTIVMPKNTTSAIPVTTADIILIFIFDAWHSYFL